MIVQVVYRGLPGREDSGYWGDHYIVITGLMGDQFLYNDPIGGSAARSFADGFSHSGQNTSFSASMANVESQEWKLPLLYLYRRQLPDSGGAGRWRGGLTSEVALTPLGVPHLVLNSTNTAGTEASNAHGIDGGYPGAGSQVRVLRGTDTWKQISAGSIPRNA